MLTQDQRAVECEIISEEPKISESPSARRDREHTICGAFLVETNEMIRIWKQMTASLPKPVNIIQIPENKAFVAWILSQHEAGETLYGGADTITSIKESGLLEKMGGATYTASHAKWFFSIESAKLALKRIIESYSAQVFAQIAAEAAESAAQGRSLANVVLDMVNKTKPLITVETRVYSPDEDLLNATIEEIINPAASRKIESVFKVMAEHYDHMQRGQIVMVGAPTGNGKTAFAMQEIEYALENGYTVDAFLMETTFKQFVQRWICRRTRIMPWKLRSGNLSEQELALVRREQAIILSFKKCLHFSPGQSWSALDIDAMIQERKAKTGRKCDLIVIDHLNAMRAMQRGKSAADYEHSVETMQEIKDIACREDAAVLLCAQLKTEDVRNSFSSASKLPTLTAFRGGAPQEGAKVCVILHKDMQDMITKSREFVIEQKMVIVKANDGMLGVVRSLFLGPFTKHIEDEPPYLNTVGRYMDLASYRKREHAEDLNKLGFDMEAPRKDSEVA